MQVGDLVKFKKSDRVGQVASCLSPTMVRVNWIYPYEEAINLSAYISEIEKIAKTQFLILLLQQSNKTS